MSERAREAKEKEKRRRRQEKTPLGLVTLQLLFPSIQLLRVLGSIPQLVYFQADLVSELEVSSGFQDCRALQVRQIFLLNAENAFKILMGIALISWITLGSIDILVILNCQICEQEIFFFICVVYFSDVL